MKKTYYIFQKNKVVCKNSNTMPFPVNESEKEIICQGSQSRISLEINKEKGTYGIELPQDHKLPTDYSLVALRSILGLTDDNLFNQWSKASQLLHWHQSNQFCGRCGTKTIDQVDELARFCPSCGASHYPAISPCVIVLIHRNEEILLGRSPRFPKSMYSTLAGFIEPAETAEDAIHREIEEEVQVKVKNIKYYKSQSWPFPGQLMLGFFAEYHSGEIHIDGIEICAASWFSIDDLPEIPSPKTIAGQLIRSYIDKVSS